MLRYRWKSDKEALGAGFLLYLQFLYLGNCYFLSNFSFFASKISQEKPKKRSKSFDGRHLSASNTNRKSCDENSDEKDKKVPVDNVSSIGSEKSQAGSANTMSTNANGPVESSASTASQCVDGHTNDESFESQNRYESSSACSQVSDGFFRFEGGPTMENSDLSVSTWINEAMPVLNCLFLYMVPR